MSIPPERFQVVESQPTPPSVGCVVDASFTTEQKVSPGAIVTIFGAAMGPSPGVGFQLINGLGALANLVKAFVGAGISNRVVAVFDNDTAGRSALQSLEQIQLPENIVVMKLPHLPLAECYPTQGPTGISFMDINGLACSIELYLGNDVLKTEDSNYRPIEWRGLDVKLRQYQGEILEKDKIQDLFRNKLAVCEADSSKIAQTDWTGMKLLLTDLRAAFQKHDSRRHLEAEELHGLVY